MLIFQVTDPRLIGVTVTDVTVDRELAFATIYVSAAEGQSRKKEVLDGLQHAAGFFRFNLIQSIDLRSFPQIRFKWDPTPERAERIEKLLADLAEEEKDDPQDD